MWLIEQDGHKIMLSVSASSILRCVKDDEMRYAFGLRMPVTQKRDVVWEWRGDVDVYSHKARGTTSTAALQVDHVIECQLAEVAMARAMRVHNVMRIGMVAGQASEVLRGASNDVFNLNVTTMRINQAKKGPFVSAINRLKIDGHSLRRVSLKQMARMGRARWMVDSGDWDRVETAIEKSFDCVRDALVINTVDVLPGVESIVDSTADELHAILEHLGIF